MRATKVASAVSLYHCKRRETAFPVSTDSILTTWSMSNTHWPIIGRTDYVAARTTTILILLLDLRRSIEYFVWWWWRWSYMQWLKWKI